MTIVIVSGKDKATRLSKDDALNGFMSAMTLFTIIVLFGSISGACFNPTAGIAITFFGNKSTASQYQHLWIYIAGPFLGGLLAGIFHLIHKLMIREPKL